MAYPLSPGVFCARVSDGGGLRLHRPVLDNWAHVPTLHTANRPNITLQLYVSMWTINSCRDCDGDGELSAWRGLTDWLTIVNSKCVYAYLARGVYVRYWESHRSGKYHTTNGRADVIQWGRCHWLTERNASTIAAGKCAQWACGVRR